MKQHTTPEQTVKLIELGFTQPKTKLPFEVANDELGYTYTIGELIEILDGQCIEIVQITDYWRVGHETGDKSSDELIDALYDMILKLKEEGII